jgi:poly-gamma-glutamate synthesis protein (capsule biosynthesis protein)
VGGNIFWGRYMHDWSQASPLGTDYPFSKLNTLHRERYDAWVAGLECPTVPDLNLTSAQQEETLAFNCPPEYLPAAAEWFDILTLANNHTDNQGAEGFETTKEELDQAGIQFFGHYDPTVADELCQVVAVPATIAYSTDAGGGAKVPAAANKRQANATLPLVMCAYHGVFQIPPDESIELISKYAERLPVIAFGHMGAEYVATPDEIKTTAYHKMIDAGADMVLGDHPHWIQTTEAYKGKLIVYSMGNFMFDQQTDVERTRSAAVDITIRSGAPEVFEGWTEIAEQCRGDIDGCMDLAAERDLPKLALNYKFKAIGTRDSDHLARKAGAADQAAILDRLGWNQTMAHLD